ncbi:7SK snRNA methylphosphate capping enzyme-like [Argiope bruennichi]|uniref:RNA methyltransferase n=1 Tax=Argiope bruennichi TaxID=94029 RepID=A0A8T0G2N8_ARGBR|nr:7SK snRNA methylphosphate capping enzyme-like [Argiope bruennichi]KAF8796109.1 7SK snRNA methylphosphate capping enzyme like protein [Argiope bruennichi]
MSPPNRGSPSRSPESFHNSDMSNKNTSFGKRQQAFYYKNVSTFGEKWPNKKRKTSEQEQKYNKKKKEACKFRFGNYHQYYGYRNQGQQDNRILCMKQEWFNGKDVLDIGCNAGHFTLAIAKYFSPRSIIGIDIDKELVRMAMKNIRHYINPEDIKDDDFPISFPITYGPIALAMDPKGRYDSGNFPFNVQFVQGNFILSSDELVEMQEELFDTILCLSLTKWIHLNWGDTGIKRLFNRIFRQLKPGGNLILEAQAFQSYAKKKKLTEDLYKHYNEIQLFPEMFNEYLLKEVGFETCQLIDTPAHSSQGFSRPIYLFIKAGAVEKKPKHIIYHFSSDESCNDSDVEQLLSD